MSNEVDPPVFIIPKVFTKLPSEWTQEDMREWRAYEEVINKWRHDMWIRTGGGDDTITNIESVITGESETIGGSEPVWGERDWIGFATP